MQQFVFLLSSFLIVVFLANQSVFTVPFNRILASSECQPPYISSSRSGEVLNGFHQIHEMLTVERCALIFIIRALLNCIMMPAPTKRGGVPG